MKVLSDPVPFTWLHFGQYLIVFEYKDSKSYVWKKGEIFLCSFEFIASYLSRNKRIRVKHKGLQIKQFLKLWMIYKCKYSEIIFNFQPLKLVVINWCLVGCVIPHLILKYMKWNHREIYRKNIRALSYNCWTLRLLSRVLSTNLSVALP